MAGEFIMLRNELRTDPRVRRIARTCGIPINHAIGCLFALWSDADQFTLDGRSVPMTKHDLDEDSGVEGFADAVEDVDWLEVEEDGRLTIPRWDDHNSKTAKRRATEKKRKRDARDAASEDSAAQNGAKRRKTSAAERTECGQVRESAPLEPEPEPEPEKKTKRAPQAARFDEWWGLYPRKRSKGAAAKAYSKAVGVIASREKSVEAAETWLLAVTAKFAASPAGKRGEFVPYPASWLNAASYDDDQGDWSRDDRSKVGAGQQFDPHASEKDPSHGHF